MKSMLGRLLGCASALVLVTVLASPAHAVPRPQPVRSAPEIDPAGLAAVASLLVGGTLLLKSRRAEKK